MHILQVHNFYQLAGGEDMALANEEKLLLRRGNLVWQYSLHNDVIAEMSSHKVAAHTVWNGNAYRAIRRRIQQNGIELVHVHNTFPLISPAVYYAAEAEGVPVVQTLHNFRLLCPAATLFRDGRPCEDCVHKSLKWPAAIHRCYRRSVTASAVTAAALAIHGSMGTYSSHVDAYVTFNSFLLEKFVEGGLPREKLYVKPNFLSEDPGIGSGYGGYALFAGRLASEKGVMTLLDAWARMPAPPPLKIAGDGDLRVEVEGRVQSIPNVEYLGPCPHSRVMELMRSAALLAVPSEWYEGSPLAVIEAMACGTPVFASEIGSLKEMVVPGVNGVFFPPGNAGALQAAVERAFAQPESLNGLRYSTRRYFERHFNASSNYDMLMGIYELALGKAAVAEARKA